MGVDASLPLTCHQLQLKHMTQLIVMRLRNGLADVQEEGEKGFAKQLSVSTTQMHIGETCNHSEVASQVTAKGNEDSNFFLNQGELSQFNLKSQIIKTSLFEESIHSAVRSLFSHAAVPITTLRILLCIREKDSSHLSNLEPMTFIMTFSVPP